MIYVLDGMRPVLGDGSYIAPGARVIGQVRLGRGASVWFNAVLRGDTDWITVGEGTNVQDGTVVHVNAGEPVHIGRGVTIGHLALVHACTIGDETLIANGAMVLDGARVGRGCVIAARALVVPGSEIPDGSVVMGAPAKIVRSTEARDADRIRRTAESYRARAQLYRRGLEAQGCDP
ncbi:MAG: gamma carbonic anhydrase family protein [Gammaproteobacteria bacterium]|nr:gamma carbonic anhydrase family protein [Gammaproteobacteria bacterium]